MARRRKTNAEAADRYGKGVGAAGPAYTAGIQKAGSWVEGSIAASARRDAGLQQAIAEGRINRGIQDKGDAAWKAAAQGKGAQAYTQSVANARPKYEAGMNRAAAYQQAGDAAVAGMDNSTLEGRLAIMVTRARAVAQAKQAALSGR